MEIVYLQFNVVNCGLEKPISLYRIKIRRGRSFAIMIMMIFRILLLYRKEKPS